MGVVEIGARLSLLRHGVNEIHDLLRKCIGFFTGVCLGIHTNDGFGVRFAEVYPLVREVDFHTIDICDFLVLVNFFDTLQERENIGRRVEIDAILRNIVLGQAVAELRCLATQLAKCVKMSAIPTNASRPG